MRAISPAASCVAAVAAAAGVYRQLLHTPDAPLRACKRRMVAVPTNSCTDTWHKMAARRRCAAWRAHTSSKATCLLDRPLGLTLVHRLALCERHAFVPIALRAHGARAASGRPQGALGRGRLWQTAARSGTPALSRPPLTFWPASQPLSWMPRCPPCPCALASPRYQSRHRPTRQTGPPHTAAACRAAQL